MADVMRPITKEKSLALTLGNIEGKSMEWKYTSLGCQVMKIEQKGVGVFKNLLVWNCRANLNQTLVELSLGGILLKFYKPFPPTNQDGRHSQT